jgi:hypothetical protein
MALLLHHGERGIERARQAGQRRRHEQRARITPDDRREPPTACLEVDRRLRQLRADDLALRLGLRDVGTGQVATPFARDRLGHLSPIGVERALLDRHQRLVAPHRDIGINDFEQDRVLRLAQAFTAGKHGCLGRRHLRRGPPAVQQDLRCGQRRPQGPPPRRIETAKQPALVLRLILQRHVDARSQPVRGPRLDDLLVERAKLGALALERGVAAIGVGNRLPQRFGRCGSCLLCRLRERGHGRQQQHGDGEADPLSVHEATVKRPRSTDRADSRVRSATAA